MNIYVSNISFSVVEEDLEQLFAEYGNVTSAKIIKDKMTGKSRGFGFVEMEVESEGQEAVEDLDGFELDGRELRVKKAMPKTNNTGGGGQNKRFNNNNSYNKRKF